MVPDGGGQNIKGEGNDGGGENIKGKAARARKRRRKLEAAALEYDERQSEERLAWLRLERARLRWEAEVDGTDDGDDEDDDADDGGEFKEADHDNFSKVD